MIKSYSLFTSQIDNPGDAVEDIRRQLEKIPLLGNTAGILTCHYDYIAGGVTAAVCEALPFPVVGYTTFYQAVPHHRGLFELCVTVLTSDSVRFETAFADAEDGQDPRELIAAAYRGASRGRTEAPSLLISFASAVRPITGDAFLRMLDDSSGGVPCFGAVAVSDQENGQNTYIFNEKQTTKVGFALLALFGEVESRFYYGSFTEEMMSGIAATVTEAEGTAVKKLNRLNAVDFLKKHGLELNADSRSGLVTLPFLHRRSGENATVARTMVDFNDEGHAIFFGEIPEGSSFRMGYAAPDDILEVTGSVVRQAIDEYEDGTLYFMFSCVGRYLMLGLDSEVELRLAEKKLPAGTPFLATYAGGEICPVDVGGQLQNRYHNNSFVACALR